MHLIDPTTLQLVSKSLDACALRHQAIAQNIANASVNGAKPVRVQFEELLGSLRAKLEAGHSIKADAIPTARLLAEAGDKPIALDEEMASLSSNSMQYQALLRAMNRHLSILSVAVQEGRR
ncbi:flagellar basal body rod protein FlgB [Roseateles microcysteis]|uniref:flagellar basal body rod protein FlgB n=1 Tax=Roseateles microcysteis TaxID=3119057 RepID=UPI002FE69054